MSTRIELTVGDDGVTILGTITQKQIGQLANLTSCSARFSLLRTNGVPVVSDAVATLSNLNAAANSVDVSYRLQAADVANAVDEAAVRWTFILPDLGKIHAPGPR